MEKRPAILFVGRPSFVLLVNWVVFYLGNLHIGRIGWVCVVFSFMIV